MKKRLQRAFTIVELVIVIAVIAILAAVLIPTFVSLVDRANESNDTQLVRNLNTMLGSDVGGENTTLREALQTVNENGYDIAKMNAKASDGEIMWDSANGVFCYKKGDEIRYIPETTLTVTAPEPYEYWQISDMVSDTYSTYLYNYSGSAEITGLTTGLDVGNTTSITSISYDRSNATDAREVYLYTNGGTISINAPNDTIHHDGVAKGVTITAVAEESYHEYGRVSAICLESGHLVAESDSYIYTVFVQKPVSAEAFTATITTHADARVEEYYTTSSSDQKVTEVPVNGEMQKTKFSTLAAKLKNDFFATEEDAVAEAEGILYKTLDNARKCSTAGSTVTLLKDCSLSETWQIKRKMTLDLNGHSIIGAVGSGKGIGEIDSSSVSKCAMIYVSTDGDLTIVDSSAAQSGSIEVGEKNNAFVFSVGNNTVGARLTIQNGLFRGYGSAVYVYKGIATIHGGTFISTATSETNGSKYLINCNDANFASETARVQITGGRFYRFDPANSPEASEPSYVVDGYASSGTPDDYEYYTVTKA